MISKLRIGSRESRLAIAQSMTLVNYLKETYPDADIELVTMKTTGDRILDRTLDKIGGKGLFVKELDQALICHAADLTVHSLKDVPMEVPNDLPLLCFSKREDPRDALVLRVGEDTITENMRIGTSSLRRAIQLKNIFPSCTILPVRGNLQTRLRKLDEGEFDALVLAVAGLKRMDLDQRISRYFEPDEIIPAAGQGIMAVQGRRETAYPSLNGYADQNAEFAALAERAFVRELDGGCTSPVCAYAQINGNEMTLRGLYYDEGIGIGRKGTIRGLATEGEKMGIELAKRLRDGEGVCI